MNILKQSTAVTIPFGPFLDDTDGKTAETALTIATADVRLSKNGGANAAKNSTTATSHNELGYYNIHLSATDTNTLGALKVMVSKEGALPVWADFMVVTPMIYDVMCGSGNIEGVKLDGTQGAITWAQQKIIANVAYEGALHVENANANGVGNLNKATGANGKGQANLGGGTLGAGQENKGYIGQYNQSTSNSIESFGQMNASIRAGNQVSGFDPAIKAGLALEATSQAIKNKTDNLPSSPAATGDIPIDYAKEATLTAIKGVGWTNQTLKAIYDAIGSGGSSITAQDVWEYAARTLTAVPSGAALEATLTALNTLITAIKGKTDTIPANPASVGSAMTLADGAITAAKLGTGAITADKIAASAITDAKIATDAISAAKVKADAVTKIQAGLAKTSELPVIPSDYAKEANATANTTTITTAITNKAVTPPTDISTLAKTSELTPLAKTTDLANVAKTTDIPTDYAKAANIPTVTQIQNGLAKTSDLAGMALEATLGTILTAIGNIDTGGGGNTPEQIRAAVGLALANLDTQLSGILTAIGNIEVDVDLTEVAKESTLTEIKGPAWAKNVHNLKNLYSVIDIFFNQIKGDEDWDGQTLPAIMQAIDDKPVTPVTDTSELATKLDLDVLAKAADLTAGIGDVLQAIDDKPVTPVTDTSELATKLDLDVLAKAADLDELLTMLTTVANDTGTTVPQLVASLPAKVWSYPFRTLTVSAIRPQTLLEGDQFSIYKDTSILIPITALGDISAYDNLWFTAKKEMDLQDGDEKAIIHIDLLTGLLYINQEVADNALGGIRIDDSDEGNISVWLSKTASALLPLFSKETLRWEVKGISGDNVDILLQGTNYILPAVTRKIS